MSNDTHDAALHKMIAESGIGTLATIRREGRPQMSNVSYTYDPERRLVRISTTQDRAKVANMRRDPRVSMLVSAKQGWSYAVLDGVADLTPVAAEPHDATLEELVDVYRAIGGEHPDWDEYRAAMIHDQRLVVRIPVDRVYGLAR